MTVTMITELPDGTTQAVTAHVDLQRWRNKEEVHYQVQTHDRMTCAYQRLLRIAAAQLPS